jgi:hypothetical protein
MSGRCAGCAYRARSACAEINNRTARCAKLTHNMLQQQISTPGHLSGNGGAAHCGAVAPAALKAICSSCCSDWYH